MAEIKLTEKCMARMERNKAIIDAFNELRAKYPEAKAERIFAGIADEFKMSSINVRNICKREGAYVSR